MPKFAETDTRWASPYLQYFKVNINTDQIDSEIKFMGCDLPLAMIIFLKLRIFARFSKANGRIRVPIEMSDRKS